MAMILSEFTIDLVNPDKQPGYLASVALQMSGGLPVRVQTAMHALSIKVDRVKVLRTPNAYREDWALNS